MQRYKLVGSILIALALALFIFSFFARKSETSRDLGRKSPLSVKKESFKPNIKQLRHSQGKESSLCLASVVDMESGRPVEGARVRFEVGEKEVVLLTGKTGTFKVDPSVQRITVEADGYLPICFKVKVSGGSHLKLPIPPGRVPVLRILESQSGLPVSGAQVFTEGSSMKGGGPFSSNSQGEVEARLPPLEAEVMRVREVVNSAVIHLLINCKGYYPERIVLKVSKAKFWPPLQLVRLEALKQRRGRVVDPEGRGVAGAKVFWVWEIKRGLARRSGNGSAVTEESGAFSWNCPRGAFAVTFLAESEGFAPGVAQIALGADGVEKEIEKEVVIALRQACRLDGLVLDDKDSPVGEARIYLRPLDAPDGWQLVESFVGRSGGRSSFGAQTDEKGRFSLEGLWPGKYEVFLSHRELTPVAESEKELLLPHPGLWVARMTRGESLRCLVFSENGSEIPEARLIAFILDSRVPGGRRPLPGEHVIKEGPGKFVVLGLPPGTCSLLATAPGFKPIKREVNVETEREVEIVLSPLEPESEGQFLTVLLRYDGAVPDCKFLPCTAIGPRGERTSLGGIVKGGKARIGPIKPGKYNLVLSPIGFAPVKIPEVKVPRKEPIEVELEFGMTVVGTLHSEPEEKIPYFEIFDEEGIPLKMVAVQEDGTFTIRGIRPGRYRAESAVGRQRVLWRTQGFFEITGEGEITIKLRKEGGAHEER